jgi:hypothetical protein
MTLVFWFYRFARPASFLFASWSDRNTSIRAATGEAGSSFGIVRADSDWQNTPAGGWQYLVG